MTFGGIDHSSDYRVTGLSGARGRLESLTKCAHVSESHRRALVAVRVVRASHCSVDAPLEVVCERKAHLVSHVASAFGTVLHSQCPECQDGQPCSSRPWQRAGGAFAALLRRICTGRRRGSATAPQRQRKSAASSLPWPAAARVSILTLRALAAGCSCAVACEGTTQSALHALQRRRNGAAQLLMSLHPYC